MHRLRADIERELRRAGRKGVDKIGEELRRHGDRALVIDLRGNPAVDPDFEIRGGELQAPTLGPKQHIPEDRQAAARRDGPSGDLEPACEVLL